MIKKVYMSAKIEFTIKGDLLAEYNQAVEDNNMSLEEQETRFSEGLADIITEELLGGCPDLAIKVMATIKEVNEEKESN